MTRILRSVFFTLAKLLVFVASPTAPVAAAPVIFSQQLLSWWASSAVDAKGVRHQAKDYPKGHAPWMDDLIKKVQPDYSKFDRMRRNAGFGLYRVTLDVKTGAVRKVSVTQSTGVATLDDSAMKALSQWLWKPEKWKEIDVPIAFMPFQR